MTDDPTTQRASDGRSAAATHYQGHRGQCYAQTVQRNRAVEGVINRDKFAPFISPGDTILDFGCASGALLLALTAAERIGIEVNAATRVEAERAGLAVHESLVAVPDESIDVAITNHALEHVLSPYDVLVEIRRVLRPTGRLVVCVPADDWRNNRRWEPGDPNHHLFAWTPLTVGNLLAEAGFDPVSVRMRHRAWPRGYARLHPRLPHAFWEGLCLVWSIGRRRREIIAVAAPAGRAAPDSTDP